MKQTNILIPLLAMLFLVFFGCQKDEVALTPHTQNASKNVNTGSTPGAQLVMDPASIPSLNYQLPAFDYARFKATHRPIDIYAQFEIEEEDLVYFMDEPDQAGLRSTVFLPAGSVDGLADAIAQAGEGGKVIVETGTHYESGRVVISVDDVKIMGQPGAVIESSAENWTPALHIKNAEGVKIQNLELVATASELTWGILIENSEETKIKNNNILGFDFSILIEQGEDTQITQNTIVGSGDIHGFININGEDTKLMGNEISNCFFGAWLCDEGGQYKYNTTYGNLVGVILCKVPENMIPLPDGGSTGSENPGYEWSVKNNASNNNTLEGYLVIDGAHHNSIKNNTASGNGTYDIELTTDTDRFGPLAPGSYENTVKAFDNTTVKDCGEDNSVTGGIQIDIDLDPCY